MEKLLYTRREAASMLSISVDKLDDLRQSGKNSSGNDWEPRVLHL